MIAWVVSVGTLLVGVLLWLTYRRRAAKDCQKKLTAWHESLRSSPVHLEGIQEACRDVQDLPAMIACIVQFGPEIDAATTRIREGQSLTRTAQVFRGTKLYDGLKADVDKVRTATFALSEQRRAALEPVHQRLASLLPDLKTRLTGLPIQATALATGILTLVGLIWLSGFYGILGIPFMPLLRTFEDVALVGFTTGLMPLFAFLALAATAVAHFFKVRETAYRPTADSAELLAALRAAQHLARPAYWMGRTVAALILILIISIAAGRTVILRNAYDISLDDGPPIRNLRIVGGIGNFVVAQQVGTPAPLLTLRQDKLRCLETPGVNSTACSTRDHSSPDPVEPIAVTVSAVLARTRERQDWEAFVERTAQCWVMEPSTTRPLLSPVFIDKQGRQLDRGYYAKHRSHWPYRGICDDVDWKTANEKTLNECTGKALHRALAASIDYVITRRLEDASLHFFGFASGTADTLTNVRYAQQRATYVAALTKAQFPALKACATSPDIEGADPKRNSDCPISIHTHAIGEMPRFHWAGTQGDPTERVVLIAACERDMQ